MQAQIVDVRNQMERRDKETQKELEQQIQVLTEQLQQKKREIQNLQQADERLRENLQRNERESKEKEKQLQEQLQVKHEQTKQQMAAVEKQLKMQCKELQTKLKENEQQTQQVNQKLERGIQQLQKDLQIRQDRQTQAVERKITAIEGQTQEKTTQIEKRVYRCENYNFPLIVIDNFKLQERRGFRSVSYHRSQCMYTHSGGYKFRFVISAEEKHVSVKLEAHSGPFDDSLQWPAKCTITLQLLNQHRDQDHITVTKELEWKLTYDTQRHLPPHARSMSQYRKLLGLEPNMEHSEAITISKAITISDTFIACDDLQWNAKRQSQYLKNDCLHFRIV